MINFLVLFYGSLIDLTILITSAVGIFVDGNKLAKFLFFTSIVLQVISFELRKNYFLDKIDEESTSYELEVTLVSQILWIVAILAWIFV